MSCQTVVPVSDISQVGEARRIVARLSNDVGFSETAQGRLAIIATELATNLVRHAGSGKLLMQEIMTARGTSLELISIDSGPGITHVDKALVDGYSTGGTAGQGLGAIRRQSDEFDIYSQPDSGTVVLARVLKVPSEAAMNAPTWGAISIPAPRETECGDCWKLSIENEQLSLMVADGLGHGPLAAIAAEKAAIAFLATSRGLPGVFLQTAHKALNGTRGAAVAISQVNLTQMTLKFAGIGNISGTLVSGADRRGLSSHNGIVGVQLRKIQEFDYPCGERAILIMHSDGIQTRWNFDDYPGLTNRHPAIIAALLYRDFERGRDDVTVVVVRFGSSKA